MYFMHWGRNVGSLFVLLVLLVCLPTAVLADVGGYAQTGIDRFNHSYETKLTGDPAQDIAIIALAQKGKTGAELGYTGDWCAAFVTDCAKYAGISNLIPFVSGATHACGGYGNGLYEHMYWSGATEAGRAVKQDGKLVFSGEAKAGDIVFYREAGADSFGHVGIVTGNNSTIEGNLWPNNNATYKNSIVSTQSIVERNKYDYITILRPDYPNGTKPMTPVISTDKEVYVLGETATVTFSNTFLSSSQFLQFYHKDSGTYLFSGNSTGNYTHKFELNSLGTYKVLYQTTNRHGNSEAVSKEITVIEELPTPVITLSKETYIIGEPVNFTLSNTEGSDSQYMQVRNTETGEYIYNKNSTGVFSHQFIIDTPGSYTILYQTSGQKSSSPPIKKSFTVTDVLPVPVIETDKDVYSLGETVKISLSNVEGSTTQYMQFRHVDSNTYLFNQNSTGIFEYSFLLESVGTYKILYHASNSVASFAHVEKLITVTSDLAVPTISTDKDTYVIGEPITITLGNVAGSISQYMQFVHTDSGTYLFNQNSTDIYKHQFTVDQPGIYKVLYQASYSSGSSVPVSKIITVTDQLPVPSISTDKEEYSVGDTVTITLGNTDGSTTQYMQFVHLENNEYLYNKNSNGVFVHQFVVTEPGTYKILYQTHNSLLTSEAVNKTIIVKDEDETASQLTLSASGTVLCRIGDKLSAEAETDIPCNLLWTSSNTSVASVDEHGILTVHASGNAWISASVEGNSNCSASFQVIATSNPGVVLPDALNRIECEAFSGMLALSIVILPDNNPLSIAENAFAGCPNLATVYAGGNTMQIHKDSFSSNNDLTFCCSPNSDAYYYALENGIDYLFMH